MKINTKYKITDDNEKEPLNFSLNSQEQNDVELLWSFKFLYKKNIDKIQKSDYVKTIKTIIHFSSNDIANNVKTECNDDLKNRIKINNKSFYDYCKTIDYEIKITWDIVRKNPLRVYGILIKNVFYVLEIDPNHSSRK